MYRVDRRDRVLQLEDVPQSSVGAPIPIVLADEHRVLLAYLLENREPDWDGTSVRVIDTESGEPGAIVTFQHAAAFYFGAPNDEAFSGHPLAARGLRPYRAAKIEHSSWIRQLERMNSVHPYHRPESFWELSHFVFAFHDTTFECVAHGFTVDCVDGPMSAIVNEMRNRLHAPRDMAPDP
jgi:hypothetical protein